MIAQIEKYVVTQEGCFIRVVDSRRITSKNVREMCKTIPVLARRFGISKILLDQRDVPNSLSSVERFRYANEVATYFQGIKIACVQDYPLRDPTRFGEAVAVKRGADLKIFATLEEAYDWLEVTPASRHYPNGPSLQPQPPNQ